MSSSTYHAGCPSASRKCVLEGDGGENWY
jgi:hypothetical protein